MAREFSNPDWFAEHRLAVDTYATQHPGGDDRRQRQSVALHLIALCHRLELGVDPRTLLAATRGLTSSKREWPRLTALTSYPVTVVDLLPATDQHEYVQLVRKWAATTWEAWSDHHELIRGWAADALRAIGRA
jgi:Family of unknown function (DUF5946)